LARFPKAAIWPEARKLKRSFGLAIGFDHSLNCYDKRIRILLILLSFAHAIIFLERGRSLPKNKKAEEGVSFRPLKADLIPHLRNVPYFALNDPKYPLIFCLG
jgi:hypothetical protein